MTFRPWLSLLITGAVLAGCAQQPSAPSLAIGTEWKAESIDSLPLVDRSHLSFTLHEEGRAVGTAGCNRWFAPYTVKGDKLTLGPVGSTMMACSEALMEQEQRYLKALQGVTHWQLVNSDTLELKGSHTLRLVKAP